MWQRKRFNWKIYLRKYLAAVCDDVDTDYLADLFSNISRCCYIVVAFKKYNIFKGIWESPWVGFKYFKEAFGSSEFWFAVKNTLILNIGDLIIGFPFPIFWHCF